MKNTQSKWMSSCVVLAGSLAVAGAVGSAVFAAQLAPGSRLTPPSTRPVAPLSKADAAKKSAELLAAQGADAAALGDFKAARDCFLDATTLDRNSRRAHEGLGYAYVKLNDVKRASTSFEAALAVTSAGPAGRSLSMNLAFTLLRVRNPMRAGKVLKDYMVVNNVDVLQDEEVLNALGVCLSQAGEEARLTRLWKELVTFYEQQNTKLEGKNPGQKRWGNDWISSAEYRKKEAYNKQIQGELDKKNADLTAARRNLARAEANYNSARAGRFGRGARDPAPFKAEMNRYTADVDRLSDEWKEINAKMDRPKFPNLFEPVGLDAYEPPATAIASASPGSSAGTESPATPPAVGTPAVPTTPPVTEPPVAAVKPPADTTVKPAVVTPPVTTPPVASVTPPAVRPAVAAGPRRITSYGVGFAVAPDLLITSADVVGDAVKVEVQPAGTGDRYAAEIVKVDKAAGLALVQIKGVRVGFLGVASAFAGGAITCASFPTPSIFEPAPEVIPGIAPAPKDGWQVRLNKHPRLAGAPLLSGGNVVGVATGNRDHESSAMPCVTLDKLRAMIPQPAAQGVSDPTNAIAQIIATREK